MEDVWLPFEGFAPPIPGYSGMIQKPEIAHAGEGERRARIRNVFPAVIADVFNRKERDTWGRFKDMRSLYVSYLLSGDAMDRELRLAIETYIPQEVREQHVLELNLDLSSWSCCCGLLQTNVEPENQELLNRQLNEHGASFKDYRQVEPFQASGLRDAGSQQISDFTSNPIADMTTIGDNDRKSSSSEEEKIEEYPDYEQNDDLKQFIAQLHNKSNITREHKRSFSDLRSAGESKKNDDFPEDRNGPSNH
ncbi:MAG: hypothetical protein KBB94_08265 [Legionellaceae bacterium]|nr:hypothetical protein [Legionellaceae bacterium]